MRQPDPPRQLIRHRQNIPQRINLKLVKRLVHRRLQQGFQLVHAVLDLDLGDLVLAAVRGGGEVPVVEAEGRRRDGEETVFDGFDGAVDDSVDGVDDFVDEGLKGGGEDRPISYGFFFAAAVAEEEDEMEREELPVECSGNALLEARRLVDWVRPCCEENAHLGNGKSAEDVVVYKAYLSAI